jgi:hypothetical protein
VIDRQPLTAEQVDRYVWVAPVRCPVCDTTDHTTQRTEWHDGVKTQRKKCKSGHLFFLVFEDE